MPDDRVIKLMSKQRGTMDGLKRAIAGIQDDINLNTDKLCIVCSNVVIKSDEQLVNIRPYSICHVLNIN